MDEPNTICTVEIDVPLLEHLAKDEMSPEDRGIFFLLFFVFFCAFVSWIPTVVFCI